MAMTKRARRYFNKGRIAKRWAKNMGFGSEVDRAISTGTLTNPFARDIIKQLEQPGNRLCIVNKGCSIGPTQVIPRYKEYFDVDQIKADMIGIPKEMLGREYGVNYAENRNAQATMDAIRRGWNRGQGIVSDPSSPDHDRP